MQPGIGDWEVPEEEEEGEGGISLATRQEEGRGPGQGQNEAGDDTTPGHLTDLVAMPRLNSPPSLKVNLKLLLHRLNRLHLRHRLNRLRPHRRVKVGLTEMKVRIGIGTCKVSNTLMLTLRYQVKDPIMDHSKLRLQPLVPSGHQATAQGPDLGHNCDPIPAPQMVLLKPLSVLVSLVLLARIQIQTRM